jgi:hypothetical protein
VSQSPLPSGPLRFGSRLGLITSAIGLLAIGVGWNGVAGNDLVVEQLPYLVSGGLIGMALVILGAAFTIAQNSREDAARLEAKLDELVEALAAGGSGGGAALTPADASGLVAAGTASYHAPSCRLVDGREAIDYLTAVEAEERGLKACRVCTPESTPRTTNVFVR